MKTFKNIINTAIAFSIVTFSITSASADRDFPGDRTSREIAGYVESNGLLTDRDLPGDRVADRDLPGDRVADRDLPGDRVADRDLPGDRTWS
ncbi:MAG: hypothetical protein GY697_12805 [Desulfobacterales bacterium]|nr:hypothetical protein [Desulfobacterales bacterium]